MNNKTVIVILSGALLLFLYIQIFDKESYTTEETLSRKHHLLKNFRPQFVNKIEITNGKSTIKLIKQVKDKYDIEYWQINHPINESADSIEIGAIISSLDFVMINRTVKDDINKVQYGLDTPTIKVTASFGNETINIKIGAVDKSGMNRYVQVNNQDEIYVVQKDFFDSMNKGVDDLRDKHFLSDNGNLTSIKLKSSKDQTVLKRDSHNQDWLFQKGKTFIFANQNETKQLATFLNDLKVTKFIPAQNINLKKFKLDKGLFNIDLIYKNGVKKAILVGGSCETDSVYILEKNQNTVSCVSNLLIKMLNKKSTRYEEKKVALFLKNKLKSFEISTAEKSLIFNIDKSGVWTFSDNKFGIDQVQIDNLLTSILSTSGVELLSSKNHILEPDSSRTTLLFKIDDQDKEFKLSIFKTNFEGETRLLAQRDDEPFYLILKNTSLLDLIATDEIFFREKKMTLLSKNRINKIEISSKSSQTLIKNKGEWEISNPASSVADKNEIKKLLKLLSNPHITGFAKNEDNDYGLTSPTLSITAHAPVVTGNKHNIDQTESETITIDVGIRNGINRYVKIRGNDTVFMIAETDVEFLNRPLSSINSLQINMSGIVKIKLEKENISILLIQKNNKWYAEDGQLDSPDITRAIINMGAMRVDNFNFGNHVKDIVLTASLYGANEHPPAVIEFATPNDNNIKGILARRTDIDITYLVSKNILQDLLNINPTN